jgi:probable HAF family extracellular repeat protein
VEDTVKPKILLAFLLLSAPISIAQTYTITDLGSMLPTAINDFGQVVGNSGDSAFIWSSSQGLRNLGTLSGGTSTYAASINDLGVVTGYADGAGTVISTDPSIPNQVCTDLTQPFLWTSNGGLQGLGTLGVPPAALLYFTWCETPFYATGINAKGQVVGYTTLYSDETQYAFLWSNAEGFSLFGSSWPPTMANGVSDLSEIVGQTGVFFGVGTLWRGGEATTLATLPGGAGDYLSSANAVNDLQGVVGWSTPSPASGPCEFNLDACTINAVLWKRDGAITDLGTLSGDTLSMATSINLFGQVIGVSGNTLDGNGWGGNGGSGFGGLGGSLSIAGRPFIWNASKGMRDLNSLIPSGSGWILNSVSGINIWGQIVGSGTLDGESHGFLLTP